MPRGLLERRAGASRGVGVRVSTVGEFGLIDRLSRVLGGRGDLPVLVGIGDDAAAWRPTPNTVTVATTDALVEGVHFDVATTPWKDLGWKALAENASDIAAMGCRPRYALVALGLDSEQLVAPLEDLYQGMAEAAEAFQCRVVGGDVVRAPCVLIHVTLIGESLPLSVAADGRPLLERSRARVGDAVALSGPVGGSAGGLRLLTQGPGAPAAVPRGAVEALLRAHRRPRARIGTGLALVEAGVRCAIDVSDGLVADIGHLCEQSGVDIEIEAARLPLFPQAVTCFGDGALDLALSGGEDYELVCAAPLPVLARASNLLAARGEPPLVIIGSVFEGSGPTPSVRVRAADGNLRSVGPRGYRHFDA